MLMYAKVPHYELSQSQGLGFLERTLPANRTSTTLGIFEYYLGTKFECESIQELEELLSQDQKHRLSIILKETQEYWKSQNREPLLSLAVLGDSVSMVQFLINLGFIPNERFHETGRFPICGAKTAVMRVLLDGGADPNIFCNGETPLLLGLIATYQFDSAKLLIEYGANVTDLTWPESHIPSILHTFAGWHVGLRDLFVEKGVNLSMTDSEDQNAAFYLVQSRDAENIEYLEYLIQNGVDVCKKNIDGDSPIVQAILSVKIEYLKRLIKAGCDILTPGMFGFYPVHAAVYHPELVLGPFQQDIASVMSLRLEALDILIQSGASLNVTAGQDQFPFLSVAYRYIQYPKIAVSTLKHLIEKYQLDLNAADVNGSTLLHSTVYYKEDPKQILELLKLGADPNAVTNEGITPTMLAVDVSDVETIRHLLEFGADLKRVDVFGAGILNYFFSAMLRENVDPGSLLQVARLLNDRGIDLNGPLIGGDPILHALVEKTSQPQIAYIRALLEEGLLDPTVRNYQGVTVMDRAGNAGNQELKLLLEQFI